MLKILKNLKQSWIIMVSIIILLCIQAMADLNLPDYTSKIVNIGIQQKGIENSAPEVITKNTLDKILIATKDDDFILENYELFSKNTVNEKQYNKYLKQYPNAEKQETFIKKNVNQETQNKLNISIGKSLIIVSMLENEETSIQLKQQIITYMGLNGQNADNIMSQNIFSLINLIPEEQLNELLDIANAKNSEMPDSIIEQSAISLVQKEYSVLGANLDKIQSNYIWFAGFQMLIISLISMASACFIILLSSKLAAKLGKILREKVFKKVLSFSSTEYRKFGSASLITRNTNDIQQIQNLIPMLFRIIIYAPIVGIGAFLKVLSTSGNSMAWIIGIAVLAILFVIGTLFALTMPKFKKLQNLIDKLNMVSREILTGIPVIRAFNKEKYEENKFDNANKDLMKTNIFVNRGMSIMMPALMFIMNSITLLIVWVGADKVNQGVMQVGNLMAFIQYTMQIVISFLFISMISIMLPRASVSAKRITDVLETEPLIEDPKDLKQFDKNKKGLVEFKDVSFRYPDADTELLTDINFTAKPGEITAIIGSTGSGKSSVVNLIPRFYDVTGGEILIDGVNIKQVSQKSLRDIIGFVPQKGVLNIVMKICQIKKWLKLIK